MSEHNRRAKYYRLTSAGRKQLVRERSRWEQIITAIAGLMKPAGSEGQP